MFGRKDEILQNANRFFARSIQIGQIHADSISCDPVPLPAVEIILVHGSPGGRCDAFGW
jgi:hypothetical protein